MYRIGAWKAGPPVALILDPSSLESNGQMWRPPHRCHHPPPPMLVSWMMSCSCRGDIKTTNPCSGIIQQAPLGQESSQTSILSWTSQKKLFLKYKKLSCVTDH